MKKKEGLKYIGFLCGVLGLGFVLFAGVVMGVLGWPKGVYHSSYQSMIQDKYELLRSTTEPKIIMVSGSSGAFGLDQAALSEATGYPVVNLGLHAGFGAIFYSEIAKSGIREGDIVLLAYEYGWETEKGFDKIGTDLVMSGIDDKLSMYRFVPFRKWKNILGYLPTFATYKNLHTQEDGLYSREAFDPETTQLVYTRDFGMSYDPEYYGVVTVNGSEISEKSVEYLRDFKAYAEKKGAKVYFVATPLIRDSVVCDYAEFTKLAQLEEELIGIPYISDPIAYFYSGEYMYDALYHCNDAGEALRTQMLIEDLKNAGIGAK